LTESRLFTGWAIASKIVDTAKSNRPMMGIVRCGI